MKYSALALLLTTTPAFAEITPSELFGSWQNAAIGYGIEFGAETEELDGDTLLLTNVSFSVSYALLTASQNIEWIEMRALEDGSVEVISSPNATIEFVFTIPGQAPATTKGTAVMTNLTGRVVGDIDDYVYTSSMDEMVTSQSGTAPGTPMKTASTINVTALQNTYHIVTTSEGVNVSGTAEMESYVSTSQSKTIDGDENPLFTMAQSLSSSVEGFAGSFELYIPAATEASEDNSFIPEGLTGSMEMTYDSQSMEIDTQTNGLSFLFGIETGGGEAEIRLGENEFSYGGVSQNNDFHFSLGATEEAFEVSLAGLGFNAVIPFRATGAPNDAKFDLQLENLTMADRVWQLFDPSNEFERGPASLDLSLIASMTLLEDLTDFEALENLTGPPVKLHSITLETLAVNGENAELTASGALDFVSLAGPPTPDAGSFSLAASGMLALLDKVGRVPGMDPMAIMGAKGAFGMFATQGETPDSFTSEIEFIEGGGVVVNGQRVR